MNDLSIVVGVSTVLGLAGLALWAYYLLEKRRLENEAADSIAEDLEGPAKFKADAIVKIILSFKDEKLRLEAIEKLTGYDERKAKVFAKAQEAKPEVMKLQSSVGPSLKRMWLAGSMMALFSGIGIVGHLVERTIQRSSVATPPAVVPNPGPASATPAASAPASAAASRVVSTAVRPVVVVPDRQTLTFESGPRNSGPGKQFSGQYEVCSQGIPRGYRIESASFRLTGDRQCNAWSTCTKTLDLPDRVCWSFSLQGHEEIPENDGIKQSSGILTVVIVGP